MTIKQRFLKVLYPAIMWVSGLKKHSSRIKINTANIIPATSFYDLQSVAIDGQPFDLSELKGKKIMLVNTASDCGFTGQYDVLETLYKQSKNKLVILGFPANDFKNQETGDNNSIAEFCKINYGVTFPLLSKSSVVKGQQQNPVFNWLSNAAKNGWNDQAPTWNFCKYLVDENGMLTHFFDTTVSPLDTIVLSAVNA